MNARQKAKHYKKLYEDLIKQKVPYTATIYQIETLRVKQIIDSMTYRSILKSDRGNEHLKRMIADKISYDILQYADIKTFDDFMCDSKIIEATIKVVDLKHEKY